MPEYTQADMPMRIDTALGEDELLLKGFSGVEGISIPFAFQVDLLSEDPEVAPDDVLRTGAVITVDLPDGEQRQIHGVISRFIQRGWSDELTSYQCELVPWLWFLSLSRECRIYQEMSVLEIAEEVFKSHGYSDFDIRCVRSYPQREYCVQYRESHLDFISRLLEEEGIFYFFEHTDSEHTLVLADDNTAIEACAGPGEARMRREAMPDEDVVTELEQEHSVHAGTVALADYDYMQPSLSLRSEISGNGQEEIYDYHPGRYTDLDEGDRYARIMLEREEAERHVAHGESTCRHFQGGAHFDLKEHRRRDANQTYILTRVGHYARAGDYRAEHSTEMDYRNDFVAIPQDIPFRPPRRTPKPVVQGAQTAVVVGEKGEDIPVDKHGRVKVQFHWDREGKKDENSSCWVRVSQNWAGPEWGGMFIPHAGQEVIVSFLEGDPDRPIITGRVYNAKNMSPLSLPGDRTKSIIRDHGGNEIVMEGKEGEEQIRISSPYANSVITLGAPSSPDGIRAETDANWYGKFMGDAAEEVAGDKGLRVLGSVEETVGGDHIVKLGGLLDTKTGGPEVNLNADIKSTTTVGAHHDTFVGTKVSTRYAYVKEVNRGKKVSHTYETSKEMVDNGKDLISATKHVKIEANTHLTLTVGDAQIIIEDDTIVIGAKKIILNGTNFCELKSGGNIKMTPDGKVDVPKGKLDAKHMNVG